MATIPTPLLESNSQSAYPRIFPEVVQPGKFASGATTFAVGTVIAMNTSTGFWAAWANGGANGTGTPRAVVYPDPVTLSGSGEVIGNVMLAGRIHVEDIPNIDANLRAAIKAGDPNLRELGIIVEGLVNVY